MKNKITKVLLLIVFACTLYSCKRDKPIPVINVSGTVLNEQTGQPIQGITVSLEQSINGGTIGGSGWWNVVTSKITESNGTFSFSQEADNRPYYIIEANNVIANNNYSWKYSTNWFHVTTNNPIVKTIYLYRNATLTVMATTVNPLGSGDTLIMNLPVPDISCNCNYLTTDRAKGGAYNKITWTVIRNSVTQNFEDSVYCPVDTTKFYTINY